MSQQRMDGRIALVTGGSRGVGKGIAEELAALGATVYVTGRTVRDADLVAECIRIPCDHTDDDQVRAVVDRVITERQRIDLLVNNVWGGYERMIDQGKFTWTLPFWRQPLWRWDLMFSAGVRAHYVASALVGRHMVERRSGLIVNISFWAAQKHVGNVAYGVAKAATDKLTWDTAHELRESGITVVSLYPGMVRTEKVMEAAAYLDLTNSESPRFIGRAVAALATDANVMEKSGSVLTAAGCAREYGFTDIDGKQPRPLTAEDV
jgi:NAD(P)-dependent dehydrogenase (short-subunit alcohol dehydrogenase family)